MAGKLYDWFDTRLKLKPLGQTLLDEPIPGGASWIYVFGSATLFLFCLQATTGMPNAVARMAISWPMLPKPMRPSVRPERPRAFE